MALMVECPACKGAKCDQCNQQGWIVKHDLVLRDVRMTVDPGNVTDNSQRIVTPPPCPCCEAAARELADLRARLEALADEWEAKPELSVDGQSGYTMDTLHGFALMATALRAELRKETK